MTCQRKLLSFHWPHQDSLMELMQQTSTSMFQLVYLVYLQIHSKSRLHNPWSVGTADRTIAIWVYVSASYHCLRDWLGRMDQGQMRLPSFHWPHQDSLIELMQQISTNMFPPVHLVYLQSHSKSMLCNRWSVGTADHIPEMLVLFPVLCHCLGDFFDSKDQGQRKRL